MRVLIVPASKHGGTAEIGRALAKTLRAKGLDVDVSQPEHMFDLAPYGAFVVGSGLYLGDWLDQASTFVKEHQDQLQQKPTWLFSSGPLGAAKPNRPINDDVVEDLTRMSAAREHRLFSGRLDIEQLGRTERFIAKWVGADTCDHREWDEIEEWANGIAAELRPASDRVIDGIGRDHR